MTVQLSKEQIDAIKVELKKYGLNVLPMPGRGKAKAEATETVDASPLSARDLREINAQIAKVKAMPFNTAAVKSRLLRNYQHAKRHGYGFKGVTSYEIGGCYPYLGGTADKIRAWYAMPHDVRLDICKSIQEIRTQFRKAELALDAPISDFERLSVKVDNYQEWDRALKVARTDPKDMTA